MVCKIIFRCNNEDTKIHQMLEALEHPLGSPRIFEAKERGECFAPFSDSKRNVIYHTSSLYPLDLNYYAFGITWAPPSDRQREGGVLSTLLTEEPWIFRIFDFSIFDFRFWHFDLWLWKWAYRILSSYITFMRLTHLDMCFCLISVLNVTDFEIWRKNDFSFFTFLTDLVQIFIVIFKIKSVK